MHFGPSPAAPRVGNSFSRRTFLVRAGLASLGMCAVPGCAGRKGGGRAGVVAREDRDSGRIEFFENGAPVLRYNFGPVEPGEVLKSVSEGNRKYAVARSDYIHPLWGLEGEELTRDWSPDHPHHRGIYWAWPEVDWRGRRGDLHALQSVFARPVGFCQLRPGRGFAEVLARNQWVWETGEPIVRETATVRAWAANGSGRAIDLRFEFEAVDDPVDLARRGTNLYGGLNVRLNAVRDQVIRKHTDAAGSVPRRAWSDVSGVFGGGTRAGGVAVFQHPYNPGYPGDWIEYPELNWVQPTFPAAGTRHRLQRGAPLVLRYRVWIHAGSQLPDTSFARQWDAASSLKP